MGDFKSEVVRHVSGGLFLTSRLGRGDTPEDREAIRKEVAERAGRILDRIKAKEEARR